MQQVRAGERLCRKIGRLHQFQRRLAGGGIAVAAPGGDQALREPVALRDRVHPFVGGQHALAEVGQGAGGRAVAAADAVEQQVQREQFGGVGLRRRHRAFRSGEHVDVQFGGVGEGGVRVVGDGDGERALGARDLDGGDEVRGPAGLADGDHEDAVEAGPRTVERHRRGRGQPGGQAVLDLHQVLGVEGGVVAGAAGDEQHESWCVGRDPLCRGGELLGALGQQPAPHLRLLGDLGGHELSGLSGDGHVLSLVVSGGQ